MSSYTQLKLKPVYREKLKALAEADNRSMANMVELLIDQFDIDRLKGDLRIHPATLEGMHQFAASLTQRVRDLDEKERRYELVPGQADEILTSMIENFVYTVISITEKWRQSQDQAQH